MTAMMSPSWTTSPSPTRSSVTVPETSASTGISIFIDSRMTKVSPSSTGSPAATRTFQTFATISARTSSATGAPLECGYRQILPRTRLGGPSSLGFGPHGVDQAGVVDTTDEPLPHQELVAEERQVGLGPDDLKGIHRGTGPGE